MIGAALASVLVATVALAADDVQVVQLRDHTFYIPKAWWGHGVSSLNSKQKETGVSQGGPLQETELFIRPQPDWKPYGRRELPEIISVGITAVPMSKPPPFGAREKRWIEYANTHEADQYGFVQVRANPHIEWDDKPTSETLVLKGYFNEAGSPLIVDSQNHSYPGGGRTLSEVSMMIMPDMSLRYQFNNRQFPESTWFEMHRHVLEFVKFLETQK